MEALMKVQFVHREDGVIVERGNIVDVLSTDSGWYRIDDGCGSTILTFAFAGVRFPVANWDNGHFSVEHFL